METTSGINTDTPQPDPAVPAGVQAAWAVAGFPGELRAASYLVGELAAVEAALYREIPLAPHPLWLDEVCDGLDAVNRSMVMSMLRSFDLDVLVVESGHLVNVAAVPLAVIY